MLDDLKIEIRELFLTKIQSTLEHAGLGSFIITITKKATEDDLKEVIHWLNAFSCNEVAKYTAIRVLIKDEVWENYKVLGLTSLVEVKMFNEARRNMVKEWRKRPTAIRRVKEWQN